ncbi:hypothetical protein J3R82DRAFT_6629 [Butyriboletus roseoflavus]|nr:hypothetical protein J3R82DRAFT_6629 [Butyriboletus roseoflavus]
MASSSLSFYSSVFGFIVGGISLLGFVISLCRPHLPTNKIKTLETLLHETENTFNGAVEDGLLMHDFIQMAEHRLAVLKEETYSLRSRAYNATTLSQDYAEFLSGTSTAIGRTCQSLKKLRAAVITSSEERRGRLTQIDPVPQAPSPVPPSPEAERPPSTEILRPRSCPPALPAYGTRNVLATNPFGDPSRSDSDVRSADVTI